ncbi:MAG: hypothetical protein ABW001_10680 [Mycobacterium sp.]
MLEPTDVLWLLAATAIITAATTYLGLAVARRKRRRASGFFALGVVCGVMAGPMLLRRSRGLRVVRSASRALLTTRQSSRR